VEGVELLYCMVILFSKYYQDLLTFYGTKNGGFTQKKGTRVYVSDKELNHKKLRDLWQWNYHQNRNILKNSNRKIIALKCFEFVITFNIWQVIGLTYQNQNNFCFFHVEEYEQIDVKLHTDR